MTSKYNESLIFDCIIRTEFHVCFSDKSQWFKLLFDDICYEINHTDFYFPLVTILIVTLLLNLVAYLLKKIL